jgi:hypothetical protein
VWTPEDGSASLSRRKQGSSPLGSANDINGLHFEDLPVSRPGPVEILGSRASPRLFNFDAFEPTVFALARRVSMPAEKQAADLTPRLAASPSDHEQANT